MVLFMYLTAGRFGRD